MRLDAGDHSGAVDRVSADRSNHDRRHRRRGDRDEHPGDGQLQPDAGADGVRERCAGADSHAPEEEQDAELADREVGRVGNLPRERAGPRQRAEHQRSDQRPAAHAELDLAAAGQRDRHLSQHESDRQAGREAERVDLAQTTVGVAERRRDVTHLLRRTNDAHPVAEAEHEVAIDHQIGVAASNPRRHRTESAFEVDLA